MDPRMKVPARIPYDACPLCDGQEADLLGSYSAQGHALYKPALPSLITWVRCRRCSHVFTDGYFNEAAQALLFSESSRGQTPGVLADAGGARLVSALIVETVSGLRPAAAPGRWLDVGFGNGALLTTAAEDRKSVV